MWLSRIKYFLLILLVSGKTFGQTVPVSDPVLADYLCTNFGLAMVNSCAELDTLKAESEYTGIVKISLINKGVQNADEILYFKNLDTLYLGRNNLNSFPEDISRFRSLVRLNLANNALTSPPNILYNNPISGDTGVSLVYLQNNKISLFPANWNSFNNITQVIDLSYNELTSNPDFGKYYQLRRLDLSYNYLGFESLIPIKKNPRWETSIFTFFPQNEFELAIDSNLFIGDTIKIDVSSGLASNEYILLKGDRKVETNRSGIFEYPMQSEADSGLFWVKIRNDSFPDASDFLASQKIHVSVKSSEGQVKVKRVFVFSPDGDGIEDSFVLEGKGDAYFYDKSGRQIRMENLPFEWQGDDRNGRILAPGLYFIQKPNDELVKVLIAY